MVAVVTFRHDGSGTPAEAWRAHEAWSRIAPLDGLDTDHLDRVVVLAAHPDDETLGAGGLVATAHARGVVVDVVVATLGERSHPRSPTHTAADLARTRRGEAQDAVRLLGGDDGGEPELLGLPDGALAEHETALVEHLVGRIGDGRRTLLVAPWRHDGHPDHEAAGRAASTVAVRTGARLVEHPVWWWHWAEPSEAGWGALRTLRLDEDAVAAKAAAVAAHRSQVAPLSDQPGDETLLSPAFLAHFAGPVEVFVEQRATDAALDDLHAEHEDPWGVDRRWYEERKRALVLACLPGRTYARALEVGCSTGALSAALAERCEHLLATDASPHAVAAARRRLGGLAHVEVREATVPDDWPDVPGGALDLVVLSEVAYFLSPAALDALVERVRDSLAPDGVVLLCHWRHPVRGWVLDGPDTHEVFRAAGLRPVAVEHRERDIEILVLAGPQSMPSPSDT